MQNVRILFVPDVLRLIAGSRLPEAERMERWMFDEVLPTVIRTGSYGPAPSAPPRRPRAPAPIAPPRADRSRDRIIRMPEVVHRTGLHRATIYRRIRDGAFPSPIALGANSAGWYESDVNAWIADPTGWGRARPGLTAPVA